MAGEDIAPPFGFGYAQLDRKIDIIERDFRSDIAATNTKIDGVSAKIDRVVEGIFERLDRRDGIATLSKSHHSSPSNGGGSKSDPYQLIGTALLICAGLGSAGTYVASNLQSQQTANMQATKDAMLVLSDTLKKETLDRQDSNRRMYDTIQIEISKVWPKEAHAEYEKRVDQVGQLRHDFYIAEFTRLEKERETMVANMVPRAEHEQQWKNDVEDRLRIERQFGDRENALSSRINQDELRSETKFAEVDRVTHGYGIPDELKVMQDAIKNLGDKVFTVITKLVPGVAPETK